MHPQQSSTSREKAAKVAFSRPWCGQVATPGWWVSLVWCSDFISCWFSRFSSRIWRNNLWSLAL